MLRAYRFAAQLGFSLDAPSSSGDTTLRVALPRAGAGGGGEDASVDRADLGRMLAEGLLGACIRRKSRFFRAFRPAKREARWTAAKLRCPAFDPAAFRLPGSPAVSLS
ncbi:MAG: hypothetical protein V8S98_11420 [Lachnospiraceae bacterium]